MAQQGTIKKLLAEKRCGFIRGTDGVDCFFHQSGLQQTAVNYDQLREGDAVEFTRIDGVEGKGPRAIEVRVTRQAESAAF